MKKLKFEKREWRNPDNSPADPTWHLMLPEYKNYFEIAKIRTFDNNYFASFTLDSNTSIGDYPSLELAKAATIKYVTNFTKLLSNKILP